MLLKQKFSLALEPLQKCVTEVTKITREVYFTPDPFGMAVSSTNR